MNRDETPPEPVAVIGMGCLFPRADGLAGYWANIRDGVDAITDVPPTHWRPGDYLDPDPRAPDRTYAARGGFLTPVEFPPLEFGISPNTLEATDSTQLLGLLAARQALEDAGYGAGRTFDRDRVSVILGVTGTLPLVIPLGARLGHPLWRRALKEAGVDDDVADDVVCRIADGYVGWQEDSFPGLLGNVVAGRIANRLDLRGTNCVVDAACASSLSAVHLALLELWSGRCDMALTGGMDTFNDIFMYLCFSKTPALAPSGNAKPFDASADGTILGEGLGCVLLKRLADAERDGNRVYAVIKGIGTSSDGKGNAIYAPSPAGQTKALWQAYRLAGVTPDTIELVEAHGTGTRAGDAAEATALNEVYAASRGRHPPEETAAWCALGSVKSQIGHTKAAAGAAGLIKAALALYHKVLPPTIKVSRPIEPVAPGRSPFYVNTVKRPWLPRAGHPRRAAVSAFGFGGSNFHCVLEEHRREKSAIDWDGRVQLAAFSGDTREQLEAAVADFPADAPWEEVRAAAARSRAAFQPEHTCRLVLTMEKDKTDLAQLLAGVRATWDRQAGRQSWTTPDGAFFANGPRHGKLALLFPGQGSQYVGMLRDLACQFPQVMQALAGADFAHPGGRRLSDRIYPPPAFSDQDRARDEEALRATDVAQPALGAVSLGALRLLEHFGVRADAVAGHSYGELIALCAAGRINAETLQTLSRLRGRLMAGDGGDRGAMLAVQGPIEVVQAVLRDEGLGLTVANKNAPNQTVLSGARGEVRRAAEAFARRQIPVKELAVAAAFHSPFVAAAQQAFLEALAPVAFATTAMPVFANTTGGPYPDDPDAARRLLGGQLAEPVEFVTEVDNLYAAGAHTFLEVGPGNKLTGLVGAILQGRDHTALALDASGGKRSGVLDLARTLAQLAVLGHPIQLPLWDEGAARAVAAQKPAMTVRICGANYVKPKPPGLPRTPARLSPPAAANDEAKPHAGGNGTPPANGHAPRAVVPPPTTSVAVMATMPDAHPPAPPAPVSNAAVAQALRLTQEGLLALQKLGEQTSQLHRQYLDGQDRALQAFQSLLGQQQALLQAGLGLSPAVPLPALAPVTSVPAAVPSMPAAPPPSLPSPPPVPAAASQSATAPPPVLPAPANGRAATTLLEVLGEKTGYPPEMLELDMELDADLGIDSIKRVEIFAALQERLPHAPAVKSEHLGTLRTLRQVVGFLENGNGAAHPGVPATSAPALAADEEAVVKVLLGAVSDKTGYPPEMLELDMELDADLGIDSIKRVEIFAALQERLPHAPAVKSEHLGTLRTLRQVAEFLGGARNPGSERRAEDSHPGDLSPNPVSEDEVAQPLQRLVLGTVALDGHGERGKLSLDPAGEVWITTEAGDLAVGAARRLEILRHRPRLVSLADLGVLESPPRLAGLVVVAPAGVTSDTYLRDAFRLLQLAGPGLRRSGSAGGAVFATVSRLDGAFGLADLSPDADPTSGGLAGLAKTVRHEWPEVHAKAIDLAPGLEADAAARAVAAEVLLAGPVEVGLSPRGRTTLALTPVALGPSSHLPLRRGDVVVLTGGARGVTAEAAIALARAFAPTLVLLGRSPEPAPEPPWLAALTEETDIKRALLAHANGKAAPRDLAEQYRQVDARREIVRNMQRMEAAGATVRYRSVDVRDAAAVAAVLAEVRGELGPLRGLVHGAGVLADRRIEDKTTEQFEHVYATKVAGLKAVLSALDGEELRLLVLFSSSTGRLGRTGQVDYAVANEVLNKLAQREARRRPRCRVVAVNWGPWDGGMVTPGLKKVFTVEGIGVIPPEAGADYLVREVSQVANPPAEIVVLGGNTRLPQQAEQQDVRSAAAAAPALSVAFERTLDLEQYPFLRSHILDGRPVLPLAVTLEWLAHGALHTSPGLAFHGVNGLRVLKGVTLDGGRPHALRVLAGKATRQDGRYLVPVELRGGGSNGREVLHARAEVVLTSSLPHDEGQTIELALACYARGVPEAYEGVLFHGPDLRGIERVEGWSTEGIAALVRAAPPPATWIRQPLRQAWLADPLVLDCAFQLMALWSFEDRESVSLPTALGRYRQYRRAFPAEGVRVLARVTRSGPQQVLADIEFHDARGQVIARIYDYECVIDESLNAAFRRNRLGDQVLAGV